MNYNEFGLQMDRIIECYGDKFYPTPRVEIIYKWASRISAKDFEIVVSKLIAENERPPMPSKFKETYIGLGIVKNNYESNCVYCSGSGFILAEDITPIAYRCRCAIGDRLPDFIAKWTGALVRQNPSENEIIKKPVNNFVNNFVNKNDRDAF